MGTYSHLVKLLLAILVLFNCIEAAVIRRQHLIKVDCGVVGEDECDRIQSLAKEKSLRSDKLTNTGGPQPPSPAVIAALAGVSALVAITIIIGIVMFIRRRRARKSKNKEKGTKTKRTFFNSKSYEMMDSPKTEELNRMYHWDDATTVASSRPHSLIKDESETEEVLFCLDSSASSQVSRNSTISMPPNTLPPVARVRSSF